MENKFCTQCGYKLSSDIKFCPECGSGVQKSYVTPSKPDVQKSYKNPSTSGVQKNYVISPKHSNNNHKNFNWKSKKVLFSAFIIIFIIGIAGIVVFNLINSNNLQNSAKASQNTVAVKVGNTNIGNNVGNLPGNITAGALSVCKNGILLFAADDGIYRTNEIHSTIDKSNCMRVFEGSFSFLNIYDRDLFCVDKKNNEILKLCDALYEDNPKKEVCYRAVEHTKISSMAIADKSIFCINQTDSSCNIKAIDCNNFSSVSDIHNAAGTKSWLTASEGSVSFCFADSSSWTAWNVTLSSGKPSSAVKINSGSGCPVDVALDGNKIYCIEKTTSSNNGKIIMLDNSGDRQEINFDCKISKLLLCGQTIFAQSANDKFIWFNTDASMSHDIENKDFENSEVLSINLNSNYFCVLYKNGKVITTDINSLH